MIKYHFQGNNIFKIQKQYVKRIQDKKNVEKFIADEINFIVQGTNIIDLLLIKFKKNYDKYYFQEGII